MLKLLPSSGALSTSKASRKYCNTAFFYHLCTLEPPPNKPSKGWSQPLLPVVSSVTSTEWSFQRAVTACITIHVQWNLCWTSNGWSPPPLPYIYSVTFTELSLKRVVTASITTHIQWNLQWRVPPKGGHYLHYHPCTVQLPFNSSSMEWSLLLLPSMYSGTSTKWPLQRVDITSITIHVQWSLYWMVPPKGGYHLHYHPCTVEPLLNGPSNGWSPTPLLSMYSGASTKWYL